MEEIKILATSIKDQFGLFYDRAGVVFIDALIQDYKDSTSTDDKESCIVLAGAFVGEVVKSTYGGDWELCSELNQWGVKFDTKNWVFPFNKASKQMNNGSSDSILAFYDAIPQLFPNIKKPKKRR